MDMFLGKKEIQIDNEKTPVGCLFYCIYLLTNNS